MVRGASGLSNGGLGEASGSIFLSRKKPTAQPFATVEAEVGSWKHTRLMLDANQPLNADKTLRGRAVLISDHGGDYLPHSHRHNHTFYGILAYDFSPNTRVNIGTELHHNRSRGSSRFGFMTIGSDWDNDLHRPFPANAKSHSSARWAYSRENDGELFADVKHDFANGWQARAHYSYGFGHLKQLAGVVGASEDTLMYDYSGSLQADFTDISPRSHNLTLNLDGQYALLGRKHDFNIGASASINKDTTRYYTETYVPIDDMLAFNGNIRQPELRPDRNGDNKGHERTRQYSAYASTRFRATDC